MHKRGKKIYNSINNDLNYKINEIENKHWGIMDFLYLNESESGRYLDLHSRPTPPAPAELRRTTQNGALLRNQHNADFLAWSFVSLKIM